MSDDQELRRLAQLARDVELAEGSPDIESSLAKVIATAADEAATPTPLDRLGRMWAISRVGSRVESQSASDERTIQSTTRRRVLVGAARATWEPTGQLPSNASAIGRRIVGAERTMLAKGIVKRYANGESIRALASTTGRSYGFIHRILTEAGVQLRQRGGARRRKKSA
jgi:hypothetical protein